MQPEAVTMKFLKIILRNGSPLDRDLTPKLVPIDSLKPLGQETRKHPKTQIRKLARNLETYGFVLPIVIDGQAVRPAGGARCIRDQT
jgi:hypothetical protein